MNEYKPGQGILPHEDGGAYWPVVATVSLGSAIVLDIYSKKQGRSEERDDAPSWRIIQEPRSLLISTDAFYRDYLHGIAEVNFDKDLTKASVCNWDLLGKREFVEGINVRGTRLSLTYRDVLKVKRLVKGFSFLGKKG